MSAGVDGDKARATLAQHGAGGLALGRGSSFCTAQTMKTLLLFCRHPASIRTCPCRADAADCKRRPAL